MTTNPAMTDLPGTGASASGALAGLERRWEPRLSWLLPLLLVLCVVRLWLMPLPSSFWIDEMATVFVVQHGGADPSLQVAPQVPESIYYWLPRTSEKLLGLSELVYRLPSVLAMGLALFLIARLAARLLGRQAAWFAAFACLALRGINYYADDARPYALGICVAAASLLFLIRWLDSARWRDALLFAVCAALLWRVHLVFWPFYAVFVLYTVARLVGSDQKEQRTRVTWRQATIVFALLGIGLLPVLADALSLYREAKAHVITRAPSIRDLVDSVKYALIFQCAAGAGLAAALFRWPARAPRASRASLTMIFAWWLCMPMGLFIFSWVTGNSVFLQRYLSLALPGAALVATLVASVFIPETAWRPSAAVLAIGLLIVLGGWNHEWPSHHVSDWRGASAKANSLRLGPETPVIYPSPFIEAKPPVWRPDYPLPGFLYSHLPVYPIQGKAYLFPFEFSPEATEYASQLTRDALLASGRFMIYGGDRNVLNWSRWFAGRPELAGWSSRRLGPFGDVEVAVFERPGEATNVERGAGQ
jgi:hypothetical protein